jgi:RNase P/RNase MRP subunit p29
VDLQTQEPLSIGDPLLTEARTVLTISATRIPEVIMKNLKASRVHALVVAAGLLAWAPASQAQVPAAGSDRKPGLEVCYMYKLIRHVDEIIEWAKTLKCEPGASLAKLDFYGGESKVLTSSQEDGVMARITGLIHLEKAGAYKFAFESNDGARLKIDGKQIVEDPDVHDDRFSELGTMQVAKPGWYPISVDFFERKSTWTLRLLWRLPGGEGSLDPVPAEALAH